MKKNIKICLYVFVLIVVILFTMLITNQNSLAISENNFVLNTDSVQKKFYKFGVFSIAGLRIIDGDHIIDSSEINVISAPNLSATGIQTVKVSYGGKEYSYDVEVIDNHPGDVITLKDGSRWNFIERENNNITLLSEDVLKKNIDGDPVFIDDNAEAYVANYNEAKGLLKSDEFRKNFFTTLNINNYDSISISLPNLNIISKIAEIDWTSDQKNTSTIKNLTRIFLQSRNIETIDSDKPSQANTVYWTENKYDGPLREGEVKCNSDCYWAIYDNIITRYYPATKHTDEGKRPFCIRPQLTLSTEQLKNIYVSESKEELPFVTSANYYVYDMKNDKELFNKKGITKYKNDDIDTIYPASMTKIATVIYSIEKIEKNNDISLDDTVTINACVNEFISNYPGATKAGFKTGDTVKYIDLLYGALFKSGGDATTQLATGIDLVDENKTCKNIEKDFAKDMTDFVKTTILDNENSKTSFVNASGLYNKNNKVTMEDMAKILKYALDNDTFREIIMSPLYTSEIISGGNQVKLSFAAPNPILKLLPYYKGSKNGHAIGWENDEQIYIDTGYNQIAYLESPDTSYIVVTASDFEESSRDINQFNIYQWLYPGSITVEPYQSTISFNSNGGSEVNEIFQRYGTNITLPTPIREGYTFDGWYTDSNLTTKFEEIVMPNKDTILYAKWIGHEVSNPKTGYSNYLIIISIITVVGISAYLIYKNKEPMKNI